MLRQKRGQLTVFLLLGIFILASTAVFLYLRKDRADLGQAESIPPEFQPLKDYIEECLLRNTESALLLLGTQGGYTYFPQRISNNPASTIAFSLDNPIRVPYWLYQGEQRIPSVQDMEQDMGDYVINNLDSCLRQYAPFEGKFLVQEVGPKEAKTTIGEEAVVITLTMPIGATLKGSSDKAKIRLFNSQVSVKLRKMHRLAVDIFNAAAQQQFFEDLTIELMTAGPSIPFSGISLSCKRPKWKLNELEDELKGLLYYNVPRIRFAQTNYPPFVRPLMEYEKFRGLTAEDVRRGNYPKDAPQDLYEYYHFFFPASDKDYADLTAGAFFQRNWQFAFSGKPSDGDYLKASGGRGEQQFLRFLCVNVYRFTYDVEYPVQIVIRDPNAFGSGYAFRFALPVRIASNAPDHGSSGVTFFDLPANQEEYCEEKRSEQFILYAKDEVTGADLSGVNLTFVCLDRYSCDLGSTGFDGNTNRLRAQLPAFCRPGSIRASHPGYLDAVVNLDQQQYVDVPMIPLVDVQFRVVKRIVDNGVLGEPAFLAEGERAAIFLTSGEYEMAGEYPAGNIMRIIGKEAQYDANVLLFDEENNPTGGWIGNFTAKPSQELVFTALEVLPAPVTEEDQVSMIQQISDQAITDQSKPVMR